MEIIYTQEAPRDLENWKKTGEKKIKDKIQLLIASIETDPYKGIGKPEPLKHDLSGKWSRRISRSDRIVYEVVGEIIYIHSLKGHY